MANPEHLAFLKRGVKEWTAWRKEHRDVRPNLSGADLRGAELNGADLRGASLIFVHLSEAQLRTADLRGADLSEADLRGADLSRADLRGADLSRANLRGADLYWADLSEVHNLEQAQLDSANGDWGTKLPDGLHHPEHWLQKED